MRKILACFSLLMLSSCGVYSFTGGDVGDAKTVSIQYFQNYAKLVNPRLSQVFTEKLRDIFTQQTPLELVQNQGDLQFEGSIVGYDISPINVQAESEGNLGGSVAQNRLTITVNVIYTNTLDKKKSFEQKFSRYADFDANADISTVEDDLIDQISQELAENILNQSIGNW